MLKTLDQLMTDASQHVTKLAAQAALTLCEQKNGLLIDLREPSEVEKFGVPGAINIPRGVLEMQMLAKFNNADMPIFLHCASGGRATLAAEQLQRLGYSNVTVISCKVEEVAKHAANLAGNN